MRSGLILGRIKRQLIRGVVPYRCIFCGATAQQDLDLCQACNAALPRLDHYCRRCGEPLAVDQELCGTCLTKPKQPHIQTTILFSYQPPIDQLIIRLKFQEYLVGGELLGELLAQHLVEKYSSIPRPEAIIPVPLHSRRLRERGHNQAVELARPIARKLQIPLELLRVQRTKFTAAQAQLKAADRVRNLRNAFTVVDPLPYRHVAVVDDVITTGSTIHALSATLFAAGVSQIDVWGCAKSHYHGR